MFFGNLIFFLLVKKQKKIKLQRNKIENILLLNRNKYLGYTFFIRGPIMSGYIIGCIAPTLPLFDNHEFLHNTFIFPAEPVSPELISFLIYFKMFGLHILYTFYNLYTTLYYILYIIISNLYTTISLYTTFYNLYIIYFLTFLHKMQD